jgi:Tfp pilus assembly protein PilF
LTLVETRVDAAISATSDVAASSTLAASNALLSQAATARAGALSAFEDYERLQGAGAGEAALAKRTLQELQRWMDLDARTGAMALVNSLAASKMSQDQELPASTVLLADLNQLIQVDQAAGNSQGKSSSGTAFIVAALGLALVVLLALAWVLARSQATRREVLKARSGRDPGSGEDADRREQGRLLERSVLAHLRDGDLQAAKADLARAIEARPDSASLRAYLATVLARLGRHEDAESELQVAIRLETDEASVAPVEDSVAPVSEAKERVSGVAGIHATDALAGAWQVLVGQSFQKATPGGNATYLVDLESQVERDPENSRLRRDLSIAYLEAGQVEQAKAQARWAEALRGKKGAGQRS